MLERIASMSPRAAGERPAQVSGTGTIAAAFAAACQPCCSLGQPPPFLHFSTSGSTVALHHSV